MLRDVQRYRTSNFKTGGSVVIQHRFRYKPLSSIIIALDENGGGVRAEMTFYDGTREHLFF